MQRGGRVLILLGLILGVITGGMVFMITRAPAPKVETVPVVVAAQDIPERVIIEPSMLEIKQWPAETAPPGAVSRVEDVIGKASQTRIFNGEPILTPKLVEIKEASRASFRIPPGMVAFSIPASEVSTAGGAIQAGDLVDILVSLEILEYDLRGNESKPQYTTQLVLQNVPVLHVGTWTPPPEKAGGQTMPQAGRPSEVKTITLLVSQQDALVLKYAKERGNIDLALRAFNDQELVVTESVYVRYMVERFKFARPPIIQRQQATTTGK